MFRLVFAHAVVIQYISLCLTLARVNASYLYLEDKRCPVRVGLAQRGTASTNSV